MNFVKHAMEIKTGKFEMIKETEQMYINGGTSVRENSISIVSVFHRVCSYVSRLF